MFMFLKEKVIDVIWLQAQLQMLDYIAEVLKMAEVYKIPLEVVRKEILWDIYISVRECFFDVLTKHCPYLPSIKKIIMECAELKKKEQKEC
ncbi:MAG: hypothetical protein NDF55_08760 [archaeon GB-1867-005]|nr:hypothetical protein [Candidatus Culexmicrobium cathedralense]